MRPSVLLLVQAQRPQSWLLECLLGQMGSKGHKGWIFRAVVETSWVTSCLASSGHRPSLCGASCATRASAGVRQLDVPQSASGHVFTQAGPEVGASWRRGPWALEPNRLWFKSQLGLTQAV